jgi:hypothetical protein
MSAEWVTGIHEGYRTKVIKVGNATVEIRRPILTPTEQKRREDQVIEALKCFGKETQ